MEIERLLKNLTETYGPSGEEELVSSMIEDMVSAKADRVFKDNLGNLFVEKDGPAPKIMVAAHLDEIGTIVTNIDEQGFLRLAPVGGISPYRLVGQRLRFKNGNGGVVFHEKIKEWKELDWSKLYLDIGQKDLKSAQEIIRIGDMACLDQPFLALSGGRFVAKAMDNRSGCAILIEAITQLPDNLPQAVCFVFSVQEELGLRGAKTAAYRCEPEYGLAVDVTGVGDTPQAPLSNISLGKGPVIKVKDRSVICHPLVKRFMQETAEKNEIPYQLGVVERGGTDAGAIHTSREGVPSGVLSIPCRYVHSPSEMIDSVDLQHSTDLLVELLTARWPAPEGQSCHGK